MGAPISRTKAILADSWASEAHAMFRLAWPLILTNLAQSSMTMTDIMMLGRLSPEALAAGTLGTNLYYGPLLFGFGLLLSTAPMMAKALAQRHTLREVRRTVRQGLWLCVFVSLPVWAILWNSEAILMALGQDPGLSRAATSYVHTLQWAALPAFGYTVLRCFFSVLERPGWVLIVTLGSVGFNILANWCLIFGHFGFPALGLPGAGIATTLSSLLMFFGLVLVVCYTHPFRRYSLFGRFWRPDWPRFLALLRLGLPIGAILVFEASTFSVAAFLMGLVNTLSLSAYAIAMQISSTNFMIPLGLSQAATVRVGRAFGAGDAKGVRRAGWTALSMSVSFMSVMAFFMFVMPHLLISAFLDLQAAQNQKLISLTVTFLALGALFQIADGAQVVGGGMLRGLHDTTVPMVCGVIGYWGIALPLSSLLAFTFGYGGVGIYLGLFLGILVVSLLLTGRWLILLRRIFSGPA